MKIEVKNYDKEIKKMKILKNINYTFKEGHIYGLYGQNGSGKTMLLRAIAGLIRPTRGEIIIDGKKLGKDMSYPEDIGILIEHTQLLKEYTALENLKILNEINKKLNEEELIEVLKNVGLENAINLKVKKFSLGMNQKLAIAQAIMGNPKILLLDEPLNALDENSVKEIKNILFKLKENGAIIILATHSKEDFLELSEIIIRVNNGEIKEVNHEDI